MLPLLSKNPLRSTLFLLLLHLLSSYAHGQVSTDSTLGEIRVRASNKKAKVKLGATHCFSTFSFSPGREGAMVVRVKPPATGQLTALEVGNSALFGGEGAWRVLVLAARDNKPGNEILTDTVMLTAKKTDRFHSIVLDSFGIRADTAGLFVGVQWLTPNQRREHGLPNNLSIKMVHCDDAAETFVGMPGRGWQTFEEHLAHDPERPKYTKAAIRATFVLEE